MGIISILLFAACLSSVKGNYQYVLAPNVIRLENEETLLVGILGNGANQKVTVYFEYLDRKISEKTTTIKDAAHPVEVMVKVTADDLFKDIDASPKFRERPKFIKLVCNGPNGIQTRDIALSFTSGYLIVQTDKPLYNPAQPVYVRVLAMDESMRPIKDKQLAIELISPTNMTVGRVNFEPGKSQNGFYKGEFELPPFPDFGTWTIKAKLGGKSETYAIAPIEVREFVLPTFGVDITTDTENKCILPNQENIGVTVSATYVYGKTVEGIAGLDINIRKKGDVSDPKRVVTMGRQKLRNGKAFFTVDVKKLVQGLGGQFPAEAVLELSSTVYESATGKEETGADDYIMFVNCPFKFEFSRSKTTYRKGFTYYMQIDMLHADGRPAQEMDFVIEVDGTQTRRKTRKDGQYLEQISSIQSGIIKVFAPGFEKFATELVLKPYTGASQIVVEKVEMEGSSFIRAYTDINMDQVAQYTGILTLITSRGKIVKTVYSPPMRDSSFKLEPDDEEKMSPVGRVFAFYVNNNQLIADSSFFRLQAKCRAQLELQPHTVIVKPGDAANLTVKGPSGMWVGFNVIDKALLLLNNENILKEDKIFKEMEARDLGCGAGGGTNSEEIFKNAGLTILTNANVDAKLIQRETTECDAKKRNRRSVPEENGCYYGANPVCCKGGEQYAFDVIHEYEVDKAHNLKPDIAEPVPYIVCYSKAKTLAETHQEKVPSKCPMAFFEACVVTMTAELSTSDDARGRSIFSDQDQYAKDVSALAGFGFQLKVRKHFETSFFFEEHMISGKELTTSIKFRDSITKWSLQAIGITENTGACIATPKEVSAFKEFFIQVDLPYKVSRKEHFNVKVTVFNYINKDMNARVYLKGIRGLCYGSLPGEQSPPQLVTVPANGAKTLTFPMIPLEAGRYAITVSAFVTIGDSPNADIVEKELLVVNEGIQEKMNFTVCLDPNNQMENCIQGKEVKHTARLNVGDSPSVKMEVELPLPVTALPGTATANAYIKSNLMGEPVNCVLEGVDKMFHEPIGCGEQNMIRTAPIVYGMYFLKQTGTMEAKHEDSGTTKMRNGITRQISMYHKEDGSFTVWKSYPSSLWLTAFVAKVFCQAEHVVQGIAGRDVIQKTLSYIAQNNKEGSGDYRDDHPVYHREMQGVLAQGDRKLDPSLTAFVLTSLQECTDRTQEVEISVRRAMSALERVPNNIIQINPYLLAISTYALALSNSSKKEEFKDKLYAIRRDIGGGMFWSNHNGAPNAYDVETTAYALLAFLKFDDFKTCHKIVAWLTQQNSAIGVWHTTQDTVVAMQALATYSARTYNPDTNLKVKIEKASAAWKKETIVNSETSQILIPALPVDKNDRKFDVTVSGRGSGVLKIEMFYNRKARDDELCPFDISPISVKDVVPAIANNPDAQVILAGRQCDVCGYCNDPVDPDYDDDMIMDRKKRQAIQGVLNQKCIQFTVRSKSASNDAGMSIVRVNLETGVRVVESDLIKMQNNKVLPRYEMPSDGQGFIILYLNSITSNPTNLIFRLEDHFSGNDSSRQPASVKVYDYYKPERSCMKQYGIGQNHGQEIKYKCDDGSDQCQCMQSQCIKQVNQELFDMALKVNQASPAQRKNLPKPVEALMDYACNFEKANYVVKVEVETVGYDSKREVKSAKAIIKEAPLQGGQKMQVDDEIEFEWPIGCTQPQLTEGRIYYVIGKDGTAFNDAGRTSLKYELTGTALVIDPAYKPLLQIVMNNFVKDLKTNKGCNN